MEYEELSSMMRVASRDMILKMIQIICVVIDGINEGGWGGGHTIPMVQG